MLQLERASSNHKVQRGRLAPVADLRGRAQFLVTLTVSLMAPVLLRLPSAAGVEVAGSLPPPNARARLEVEPPTTHSVISNGAMKLRFSSSGALVAVTTSRGANMSFTRLLTADSGATTLAGATMSRTSVFRNASSLCVQRIGKVGKHPISIKDCFEPSAKADNAVQWTSIISSSATTLWSAAIFRGLNFADNRQSATTAALSTEEELWIPADSTANGSNFLFDTYPVSTVGAQTFWLGGLLTTTADGCNKGGRGGVPCSGAYSFKGPILSVPVVATLGKEKDSGLVMALDLDDFLSTKLSLQTAYDTGRQNYGWRWGYEQYRLGAGSAPLVLRADLAAIPADARAAAGFVAERHPTFFQPTVPAARFWASGTSWYSKCGPAVGGCDLIDSNRTFGNETFAAELKEIAFKWVWNNNFAEYFMGNYIPPVTNASEIYVSDAGVPVSVDLLRARYRGFKKHNVTELPYFSVMEFGGGAPQYHMTCLPAPNETLVGRRGLAEHNPEMMGPIAIQKCEAPEAGANLLWIKVPVPGGKGKIRFQVYAPTSTVDNSLDLCLTAVATTTWCGNRNVCNDELDALPCNASNAAQLWWWNGTQIASAMPRRLKDELWSGRSGRCNGWPCCIAINGNAGRNGQALQGESCPEAALWKAVPSKAGQGSAIQIQSITSDEASEMPSWCIGYQAKMPPGHTPKPAPGPPPAPPIPLPPGQEWRNPNVYFINQSLQSANLRSAGGQCIYSPGWAGSFVMDPLDPHYLRLLLKEAHRHVQLLQDDFAGVSCDRGWAQLNNAHADDGITYCAGSAQCRSLLFSQRVAMAHIGQVFHDAGKIISYNPIQIPRIDIMEHYDTIFTELALDAGSRTRLVAAMALQKPATLWVSHLPSDSAFQFGLLHGIFPMAPAPSGDHSLGMSGMPTYLKYGPMMRALQGRVWNLVPHAISATLLSSDEATGCSANLFDMPDGSLVAVVVLYGADDRYNTTQDNNSVHGPPARLASGKVDVRLQPSLIANCKAELLQLGRRALWTPVTRRNTSSLHIEAGIVMLRFVKQ